MRLWLTVFIGGQRWKVYLVSARSKHLRVDGEQKAGTCNYDKCSIYISNDQNEQAREDTLVHELIHAMLYVSGAGKVFNDDYDAEEAFVLSLTPILHRLLKDLNFKFPVLKLTA